jgi:ADP-ribose pyrophosphatase YjhB (NUDIX family)
MYTRQEHVTEMEERLGTPAVREMTYEIDTAEFDMVDSSMYKGRAHDVTMFIRKKDDPSSIVVIRKPFFPPGVFRAPSGAAENGESLESGAVRESKEETGLDVELTRYVARIKVKFTDDGRAIDWTSHVLEASQVAGEIDPIDTHEIAEARWATLTELQGPIRAALLETGWGLLRYRVALTDLTVGLLEGADA